MASRGINRLAVPRCGPVGPAIIRRAEMRTAFDHFARDFDLRLARIVALLFAWAPRIDRHAAGLLQSACSPCLARDAHSQTSPQGAALAGAKIVFHSSL